MSYTEIQEIIDCKFWMLKWYARTNWLKQNPKTKCLWRKKASFLVVLFFTYTALCWCLLFISLILGILELLPTHSYWGSFYISIYIYILIVSPAIFFFLIMGTLYVRRLIALKLRRPLGDEDFCTTNLRLSKLPYDAVLSIRNMLAKAYNMPSQFIYPKDTGRSLRKFSPLYGPFVWEIAPQLLLPGFRGNNNPDQSTVEQKIDMILCMKNVEDIMVYLAQDVEVNSAYSNIFLGGLEDGMGWGE